MRSVLVVMADERVNQVTKVLLAEDNEMVQTFPFHGLHKSLGVSVHVGTARLSTHGLDAVGFEDLVELGGELRIAVADEMIGGPGAIAGDHRKVPCLLSHPDAVRIGSHAGNEYAARADVDEEQDEHVDEAFGRHDTLGEEVAGPERLDMPTDEVVPSTFAATGSEPFLAKDVLDGLLADADAEFLELPMNLAQTPIVLAGEAQDEFPNLLARPRSAALANPLAPGVGYKNVVAAGTGREVGSDQRILMCLPVRFEGDLIVESRQ